MMKLNDWVYTRMMRDLERPRTIAELAKSMRVSERSVYRYIAEASKRGVRIVRDAGNRPVRFVRGPS